MNRMPIRIASAIAELDKAAENYLSARELLEEARVRFRAASESLATTRRMADDLLTSRDLYTWREAHPEVQYAGMGAAYAINSFLSAEAHASAWDTYETKKTYWPWRSLEQIVSGLERGGFEFRSATPGREINAALINLGTVAKHPEEALYAIADAEEILAYNENLHEQWEEHMREEAAKQQK